VLPLRKTPRSGGQRLPLQEGSSTIVRFMPVGAFGFCGPNRPSKVNAIAQPIFAAFPKNGALRDKGAAAWVFIGCFGELSDFNGIIENRALMNLLSGSIIQG
jgi:hypothetical protein